MAYLSGYTCRKTIYWVKNNVLSTNYQIMFTPHKASDADSGTDVYLTTNVQDDFDDFRVTEGDGETLFDQWREEYESGVDANYWVEIAKVGSSLATEDYSIAETDIDVDDGTVFTQNDYVIICDDNTPAGEVREITGIAGDTLTVAGLTNAYTQANNAKVCHMAYLYYKDDDAALKSVGADTFIVFDDFERGNDGDEIGGDWTEINGQVEISTEQAYKGTRSMKLVGADGTQPRADIDHVQSAANAIRFRAYVEADSRIVIQHGDGAKVIQCSGADDGDIDYHDGDWQDTGSNWGKDAWRLLEINDIDLGNDTYDIIYEGSSVQDDADMRASAIWDAVIRLAGCSAAIKHTWVDDFLIRNYVNPEPTWGTWGIASAKIGDITPGLTALATVSRVRNRTIALTPGLTMSTTISRVLAYARAVTTDLVASVTVSRKAAYDRGMSPGLTSSVTVARTRNRLITSVANLVVSAVVDRAITWTRETVDNVSVTVAISRIRDRLISVTADLAASTTIAKALAFKRAVISNVTVDATVTRARNRLISIAANLTDTVSVSRALTYDRATTSGVTVSATVARSRNRTIVTAANLTVDTIISRVVAFTRSMSANVTAAVTVARSLAYNRAVTVALAVSTTISRAQNKTISITADLTVDAIITKAVVFGRAMTANLTASVTVVRQRNRTIVTTSGLTAAVTIVKQVAFIRAISADIAASVSIIKVFGKKLSGTLTPSGTVLKTISKSVGGALSFIGRLVAWIHGPPIVCTLTFEEGVDATLTFEQKLDVALTFEQGVDLTLEFEGG